LYASRDLLLSILKYGNKKNQINFCNLDSVNKPIKEEQKKRWKSDSRFASCRSGQAGWWWTSSKRVQRRRLKEYLLGQKPF